MGNLKVVPHKSLGKIYFIHTRITANISDYRELITDLQKARKGQIIYIIVMQNGGGYMNTLGTLTHHIRASKATVIMEARGFIASAAALVVFQGNFVKIRHKARILFHNIRYFRAGIKIVPHEGNKRGPRKLFTYQTSLSWFKATRVATMMTKKEWRKLIYGGDVVILGQRICSWGVKTRVLKDTAKWCLTRGNK